MAKLSANKTVQTDIIDRICTVLECQPGEIMEHSVDGKQVTVEQTPVKPDVELK